MTRDPQFTKPAGWAAEPTDPDTAIDPWPLPARPAPSRKQNAIIAAIAAGGVIGASARYGATLLWPTPVGVFPWTTLWINVTGCAAMGVLMVLITERFNAHPLMRPFLGSGVLGGYTTFSTYALDAQHLLAAGRPGTALLYLISTLAAAALAVWGTAALTRLIFLPTTTKKGPVA